MTETSSEYCAILRRVIDKQLQIRENDILRNVERPTDTEVGNGVRTMLVSIDCSGLRKMGKQVLLQLTKGRGKWWVSIVNECVIDAVETSFRQRVQNGLLWLVTFGGGRIDFTRTKQQFYMNLREEIIEEIRHGIMGCPYSGRFGDLHKHCYTFYSDSKIDKKSRAYRHPSFYIKRTETHDYIVAALSMTHQRLGEKSEGRFLDSDVMYEIFKHVDFE